ncbi:MAG TPA: ferredoxin family protein [Bacteroidia bacterium]
MAKVQGAIVVNTERCKGCQVCIPACPQDVIGMSENVNGKGYHFAQSKNDNCTGCINCGLVCPDGVITVYRVKIN